VITSNPVQIPDCLHDRLKKILFFSPGFGRIYPDLPGTPLLQLSAFPISVFLSQVGLGAT
jgi:hypothetical protein